MFDTVNKSLQVALKIKKTIIKFLNISIQILGGS